MNYNEKVLRENLLCVLIDNVLADANLIDKGLSSECGGFLADQWDAEVLSEDEFEDRTIRELRDRMMIDVSNFCHGWEACLKAKK